MFPAWSLSSRSLLLVASHSESLTPPLDGIVMFFSDYDYSQLFEFIKLYLK